MTSNLIKAHSRFVSFCLNIAEWLGLQRNAGMALATLYISKGTENDKLSAEDVAKITGYSRSNVSLVLSQLEAMNLVVSEHDETQTGRGRKKILYSVGVGATSPIQFAIDRMVDQLKDFSEALESIENEEEGSLLKTVRELKRDSESTFSIMVKL